jgi:hypothetical protein
MAQVLRHILVDRSIESAVAAVKSTVRSVLSGR